MLDIVEVAKNLGPLVLLVLPVTFLSANTFEDQDQCLTIGIPVLKPYKEDSYLCTLYNLMGGNDTSPLLVKSFETKANVQVAHHIISGRCKRPGKSSCSVVGSDFAR